MVTPTYNHIDVEVMDTVLVVTLRDQRILDSDMIEAIRRELCAATVSSDRQRVVICFENVQFLSSAALKIFWRFQEMLHRQEGVLRLCSMHPDVYEVFSFTRLNTFFTIVPDVQQANMSFVVCVT